MAVSKFESHLINDKRLQERFLRSGNLDRKQIEKTLSSLVDVAAESEEFAINLTAADLVYQPEPITYAPPAAEGGLTFFAAEDEMSDE